VIFVSQDIAAPSPFQYRFRCSSTLLIVFADVYIYRYLLLSLGIPLFCLLVSLIRKQYPPDSRFYQMLGHTLPSLWLVGSELETLTLTRGTSMMTDAIRLQLQGRIVAQSIFESDRFLLSLLSDLMILLVFGSIFPVIAFIGMVSIVFNIFMTKTLLGRILSMTKQCDVAVQEHVKNVLTKECNRILQSYAVLFRQLLWLPPMVWAAFLFDVSGNEVGTVSSVWIILITTLGLPWMIRLVEILLHLISDHDKELPDTPDGIELRDTSTFQSKLSIVDNPILFLPKDEVVLK
jgi:hypothetical protein